MTKRKKPIIIRDIDRSNDYRIQCEKCHRDFGGTVAAIADHSIRYILCPVCEYGSVENQMRAIETRLNADI